MDNEKIFYYSTHNGSIQLDASQRFSSKEVAEMPPFKTIRQTAATAVLSEHRIRLMVAEGICPGIRTGNRFLVNVEALAELLDRQSREGMRNNA